jgi:geranylgeranyl diphosphate synthase type II
MNFEKRDDVGLEEYIEMIRLKTAVLLAGSMQIGAIIGGAEQEQADLLYEFGENLGLAFQLQDDILDVYGDPEKFGKQVGGDILADKKTFLLIKARELAIGETALELDRWLNNSDVLPENKVNAITTIYNSIGVRKLAEAEMENYVLKALNALDKIAVDNTRKELLRGFAEHLLIREH